jgi:ATP-binding cassette subfamily C (CFTR/MRP) protein 4
LLDHIVTSAFRISGPLALGKLMGYYSSNESEITSTETVIYAAIIIGANFIESVLNHTYTIRYQQLGMRFKVACSSLIYRKSLKLNHEALNKANLGHIVNLLSNDMQKLTLFWRSFNSVWSSPIQAIIVFYLLYSISGPTALIGIVFLVTLIPLQSR